MNRENDTLLYEIIKINLYTCLIAEVVVRGRYADF